MYNLPLTAVSSMDVSRTCKTLPTPHNFLPWVKKDRIQERQSRQVHQRGQWANVPRLRVCGPGKGHPRPFADIRGPAGEAFGVSCKRNRVSRFSGEDKTQPRRTVSSAQHRNAQTGRSRNVLHPSRCVPRGFVRGRLVCS